MKPLKLTPQHLTDFERRLWRQEKSPATVAKYCRDVRNYHAFLYGRPLSKELTIAWKKDLEARGYAPASINSMLIPVNRLLQQTGRPDCRVKTLRLQHRAYCPEGRQLTRAEYLRLLAAAQGKPRLKLVLQTICSTGIRVSELGHFTVEAVKNGEINVSCKGKNRTILLPGKLRKALLDYARKAGLPTGPIFVTRTGRPLDRSNIWSAMKKLCANAKVDPRKVFPHNLRKLFARSFYKVKKDIAKLADVLGHSSIETTRIYIMTTGAEHRRTIDRLGLVV